MIHYHGLPITPESVMIQVMAGRHGFVSYTHPEQVGALAGVCQSFALDNGAFSAWRSGNPIEDWSGFYEWAGDWLCHPACDWAVIPDVVDGSERENDLLVDEWPFSPSVGVPVWHLNESPERLLRLAERFPRVALGSTAEYDARRPSECLARLREVLPVILRPDGMPRVKLHGLRMLNPALFTHLPLASADSTSVGRNIAYDKSWTGRYQPRTRAAKAEVLAGRFEFFQSPATLEVPSTESDIAPLFAALYEQGEEE